MSPSPELSDNVRVGARRVGLFRLGRASSTRAPKPRNFHAIPYLGQFFGTIEINSSFYAHPQVVHAQRWRELAEELDGFLFTAKLNRVFTHEDALNDESFERQRASFSSGLAPLVGRLGALLVQFPVSFRDGKKSRERLDRIREAFGQYPLVLELRHASWFEREPLRFNRKDGLFPSFHRLAIRLKIIHPSTLQRSGRSGTCACTAETPRPGSTRVPTAINATTTSIPRTSWKESSGEPRK